MNKILILIRHAQAVAKEMGKNDLERPLNETGVMEAIKAGRFLAEKGICIEKLMISHARRSQETASLICEQLKLDNEHIIINEELYEASARTLLSTINLLPKKINCVALIGHNPSLTFFCEYISDKPVGFLPPGGLIIMEFPGINWEEIEKGSGMLSDTKFPA